MIAFLILAHAALALAVYLVVRGAARLDSDPGDRARRLQDK